MVETQPKTCYIVAVSGGIDSVVLLHMLVNSYLPDIDKNAKLVIAHFDHGMRTDSIRDRKFVADLAMNYGVVFQYGEGRLGAEASEDTARAARYKFLNEIKNKYKAVAIITAHHEDDRIETAIINILRGTGPRGLFALKSTRTVLRPLLKMTKNELWEYADKNNLIHHEDTTNKNEKYLRNYIRKYVIPYLESSRTVLVNAIDESQEIYQEIDGLVKDSTNSYRRLWYVMLPHLVACEVVASILRRLKIKAPTRQRIEHLALFGKTATVGSRTDVDDFWWLVQSKTDVIFIRKQ